VIWKNISIEYIKTIIGDLFDVKYNGEGCLSDFCIRLKHITEDSWLMVQMKSTEKPTSSGYKFRRTKYRNCIIICICLSDKKMWIFDGNITPDSICIGLTKSKNDKFEITKDTIHEILTHYYNNNIFPKYDFETTDIPISPDHKLEHKYRKYRETMIHFITFIRNERQGLVYDFMINGFKVQEKVCSQMKNRNITQFNLNKCNGIIKGIQQAISYQKGDNDFYWLNVNNKKQFYIIPEVEILLMLIKKQVFV